MCVNISRKGGKNIWRHSFLSFVSVKDKHSSTAITLERVGKGVCACYHRINEGSYLPFMRYHIHLLNSNAKL